MCQTCYEKGFKDYPKYDSNIAHIEDYKRGYKTKQNESLDADELQHTFFCDKCYARGLSNYQNGIWAPPLSTKRGHYESYEKGYNQVEVVEESKIPEYYLPEDEKIKHEKPKTDNINKIIFLASVVFVIVVLGFMLLKFSNHNSATIKQVDLITDTNKAIKVIANDTVVTKQNVINTPKAVKDTIISISKKSNTDDKKSKIDIHETAKAKVKNDVLKQPKSLDTNNKQKSNLSNGKLHLEASEKLLTEVDLKGINKQDLKFIRNEIFARHGYIFKSPELNNYFSQQPWYKGMYNDVNNKLSPIERQNVDLIKKLEH